MTPSDHGTEATSGKSMTLRLSPAMTEELELVARVRGIPMTHVVRLAVARHLAGLAVDDTFQAKLQQRLEEERATLLRFSRVASLPPVAALPPVASPQPVAAQMTAAAASTV